MNIQKLSVIMNFAEENIFNTFRLYQVGLNPNVSVMYPAIEYPVSTKTPFLSHFVEWEHSEDWYSFSYFHFNYKSICRYNKYLWARKTTTEMRFKISISELFYVTQKPFL